MARQTGLVKYEGTMGGIRHYRLKGRNEWYASMKSGPSREQVLKGKEFERTRETMKEFGCAAKAAGAIRQGMGALRKRFGDTTVNQRLMKAVCSMLKHDKESERGKRTVKFTKNGAELTGFEWNGKRSLESVMNSAVKCEWKNTGEAEVKIKGLKAETFNAPKGATHARIVVVMQCMSDMENEETAMFKNNAANGKQACTWSEYIDLKEGLSEDLTLSVKMSTETELKDCGTAVSVGVEFYEAAGEYYYAMREGGSMKIVAFNSSTMAEKNESSEIMENEENEAESETVTDKESKYYGRVRFKREEGER